MALKYICTFLYSKAKQKAKESRNEYDKASLCLFYALLVRDYRSAASIVIKTLEIPGETINGTKTLARHH